MFFQLLLRLLVLATSYLETEERGFLIQTRQVLACQGELRSIGKDSEMLVMQKVRVVSVECTRTFEMSSEPTHIMFLDASVCLCCEESRVRPDRSTISLSLENESS